MRIFYVVLLFAVIFTGCSAPDGPVDQQPKTGSDTLTILAVYGDSLYGGEQFSLKVDRAGSTQSDLKLFVHTTEMRIDSVADSIIYATANPGSPGKVRLFDREVEAKGEFSLYLYSQDIDDLFRSMALFWLPEGRIGDTIGIAIDTPILDILSLSPMINAVPLDYLFTEKIGKRTWHRYRITPGVVDGPLSIVLFGHRGSLGQFDLRHDDEKFYTESVLAAAAIDLYFPFDVQMISKEGDTSWVAHWELHHFTTQNKQAVVTHGDSIRSSYFYQDDRVARRLNMALLYDSVRRTVSGWISYMSSGPSLEPPAPIDSLFIAFKDLPWTKKDREYTLEASGDTVVKTLVAAYYQMVHPREGFVARTTGYSLVDLIDPPRFSVRLSFY